MNRERLLGSVVLVAGSIGYVLGVRHPFPGRAFTITAIMTGLLLVAISNSGEDQA